MATYTTAAGLRVQTGGQGRGGGEGKVYDVVGMPHKVAKIYHAGKADEELRQKLSVMLAYPPRDPLRAGHSVSIAWPEKLLFAPDSGALAGYLMPRIVQPFPLVEYYNPRLRAAQHPKTTWRDLHRIGRNLAAALAAIHGGPYVIGDLNEGNFLVNHQGLVALVDTDSFQVRDPRTLRLFPCRVGKPEFTPPELQGRPLGVERRPSHDLFGLGVLLFLLLMEGEHPFMGVAQSLPPFSAASLSGGLPAHWQNIVEGNFPHDPVSGYAPRPMAPPFAMLHPPLQALFRRCFVAGHTDPGRRPTAREWHAALAGAETLLVQCPAHARHVYAAHVGACPWCERGRRLGVG